MSEAETEKKSLEKCVQLRGACSCLTGGGFVQSETINKFAQIVLEDAICGSL